MLVSSTGSRVFAQLVEAGIARDAKLGTPLECLHVALVDTAGRAVAHTVTDAAGRFQLEAPRAGAYRVQFMIYRWEPLVGPVDTLTEGSFKQRAYPLAFTNMLTPPGVSMARGPRPPYDEREKYQSMNAALRSGESDSTWKSRTPVISDLRIRYPEQQVRINGTGAVLARFIVDSTGLARPESWLTLLATHSDFAEAVKSSLPRARWTPAALAGKPVCELVMDYTRFHRDGNTYNIVMETR